MPYPLAEFVRELCLLRWSGRRARPYKVRALNHRTKHAPAQRAIAVSQRRDAPDASSHSPVIVRDDDDVRQVGLHDQQHLPSPAMRRSRNPCSASGCCPGLVADWAELRRLDSTQRGAGSTAVLQAEGRRPPPDVFVACALCVGTVANQLKRDEEHRRPL